VGSRRKTPILLENLRTGQKRVYSSRTELFKEKAIQIPRMDEPFFSKVHEVYIKATPARGNGHDDVTHCHQETTTKKEAATLWSSRSAAHIQRIPVKGKQMNKNIKVIATYAKAIVTRNLEGKLNGTLSRDVSSKFGAYCRKYDVEGVLLDSGNFTLNKMNGAKIQLKSGLATLEKHLGLPIQRTFAGHPAPACWLKKMFPNGVDKDQIVYRWGLSFTNDAINAVCRIQTNKDYE
jgi:hypothetical protein